MTHSENMWTPANHTPETRGKEPVSRPIVPPHRGTSTGVSRRATPRPPPASRGVTSVCPEHAVVQE